MFSGKWDFSDSYWRLSGWKRRLPFNIFRVGEKVPTHHYEVHLPIENPNLTIINRSCWTWNQTWLVTWACCIPWPQPSFNMVTDKRCHSHLSVIQEIHHPSNWCNIFIPFIFPSYSHCLPVTQHNTSVRLASLHYHPSLKTIITRPYFTEYTTHMSGPSNLWKSI